MADKFDIEVYKRPWYEWVLWAAWLLLEIFLVQNAINSQAELEPCASLLFWMSFVVLLIAGLIVWFLRRSRYSR